MDEEKQNCAILNSSISYIDKSFYKPHHAKFTNKHKIDYVRFQLQREIQDVSWNSFSHHLQVTEPFIHRLDNVKILEGHKGCVNCIEFSSHGDLLLSGSDDYNIILWSVFKQCCLKIMTTGHKGNIFSVKFMPQCNERIVISGAGDGRIEVRDTETGEVNRVCTCHSERVKRLATIPNDPNVFFSASEDGTVMLFDTRRPHHCSSNKENVLISLRDYCGQKSECKCMAVNPVRTEIIAIGANDPFIRVYDSRMLKSSALQNTKNGSSEPKRHKSDPTIEHLPGFVQYYVPGHFPKIIKEYHRRCRSVAVTYLTFSPDGTELLANVGGDHIYLFNAIDAQLPAKSIYLRNNSVCSSEKGETATLHNGTNNGCSHIFWKSDSQKKTNYIPNTNLLPLQAESLKASANQAYRELKFAQAIYQYNKAVELCPYSAVLHSNKAVALMKRNWDGDVYAAMKCCLNALKLDPGHTKAHFRLAQCLHLLGQYKEAKLCIEDFNVRHKDINSTAEFMELVKKNSIALKQTMTESEVPDETDILLPNPTQYELQLRNEAKDYKSVYCGHCNTSTDIKEAVFLGRSGDYIAAGSDDGNVFIWDRYTTNLIRVFCGDESIVNCIQCHPSICLLATSGIESVVKLWAPTERDSSSDLNIFETSQKNQERMSAGPIEVMLMHVSDLFGSGESSMDPERRRPNCTWSRVENFQNQDDDYDGGPGESNFQCHTC